MKRLRAISLAAAALLTVVCICPSSTNPLPGPDGGGNPVPTEDFVAPPSPENSPGIDGSVGGEIATECNGQTGSVQFDENSFNGITDFKISCLSENEIEDLEKAVQIWSGDTGVLLGAIKIEPSQSFNKDVLLRIPLAIPWPELAGHYVTVYIYKPDQPESQAFEEYKQAQVDEEGRTASVRVDHFTIFALIGFPPLTDTIPPTSIPTFIPTDVPTLTFTPIPSPTFTPYTCTDPQGWECAVYKPGEPIRVAAMLSPSGPSNTKSLSNDILNGVNAAISSHPTIGGHAIIVDTYDDGCRTDWANQNADKIVSDTSIVAVIGTTCPDTAKAAIPTLSKYGLTMLSPVNTDPSLTQETYYSGFYRIAPSDVMEAQIMAKYARDKLGIKRVIIIYDKNWPVSSSLRDAFYKEFDRLGGIIDGYYSTPGSGSDMSGLIKILKAYKPDAYYLALLPDQAQVLVSQAYKAGLFMQILGTNFLYNSTYFSKMGAFTNGMFIPRIQMPVDKYTEAYSLDAMDFLLTVLAQISVLDSDGTLYVRRGALRNALSFYQGYPGKTGTIQCVYPGECAHPPYDIYKWIGQKLQLQVTVSP